MEEPRGRGRRRSVVDGVGSPIKESKPNLRPDDNFTLLHRVSKKPFKCKPIPIATSRHLGKYTLRILCTLCLCPLLLCLLPPSWGLAYLSLRTVIRENSCFVPTLQNVCFPCNMPCCGIHLLLWNALI